MVRLMAVPVDQHDVSRSQQGLLDHLVRSRSTVGDEEDVVCTEGSGGFLLGDFDIAGWFEQTIETTGSCRGFCKEEIQSIELAHVAYPVRLEDGFPSCDGQCVKRADGTLRIFLQVIEKRRVVPVCDPIEDAQVQFEGLLNLIENTPAACSLDIASYFLCLTITEEVN